MNRTGLIAWAALPAFLLLGGCVQTFNEEKVVFEKYDSTILRQSTSAQVLSSICDPLFEYLSQSESVAASWNERDKGRTHWFNMVAFDEESLLAVRKYGFSCVEQRLGPNAPPRPKVRLDAELVLDEQVLNAAYPTQNARFIAVLKEAQKQFNNDALQVTADSRILEFRHDGQSALPVGFGQTRTIPGTGLTPQLAGGSGVRTSDTRPKPHPNADS
ncbi:MAG TPA: hypothetical protein PK054_03015 [Anaerohalosphaeraceae bacterium]|nr:hypothetical protein [Anaerohalosphaeraceae bacterium]